MPADSAQTNFGGSAPGADLTRQDALTFVSLILTQTANGFVRVIVTRVLAQGLGAELCGVWLMIRQGAGCPAVGDQFSAGTLEFTLAMQLHSDDSAEKRRKVELPWW